MCALPHNRIMIDQSIFYFKASLSQQEMIHQISIGRPVQSDTADQVAMVETEHTRS